MEIFLSYSWNNGNIADALDALFRTKNIILTRDIRDLNYRDSIKEYMKSVRNADFSIMIITDEYLKSSNCSYEVTEFIKDENFKDKILPIIHSNTGIFSVIGRNRYIRYWQDKYKELETELEFLDELNRIDTLVELKKISEILLKLPEFLTVLKDMKTIVFNKNISLDDFRQIYSVINPDEDLLKYDNVDGYFMLNVPRTLTNHLMVWWGKDAKGYTEDLNEAKIFTVDEAIDLIESPQSDKKFSAIPIVKIASKFGQTIIPRDYKFLKIIRDNSDYVIGNKSVYLSDEDIKWLI